MAEGILGLGSSGAASLNQELIDKLKDAERKATVEPYENSLEDWDAELEKITEIEAKVAEVLLALESLDLYAGDENVFEQISASTSGDSAVFEATSTAALSAGSISVTVTDLAQKDVYQSNKFGDKDALITDGVNGQNVGDKISITVGGTTHDFDTKDLTYNELATAISAEEGVNASIEQVSDTEFRLVIKSTEPGEDNKLTISQTNVDLGLEDALNHTLTAQNLEATVDGVAYDVSSNTIVVDGGLSITAVKQGDSTISIEEDRTTIIPAIEEFANRYNELVALINGELTSEESPISDTSSLRMLLSSLKDGILSDYNGKNIFSVATSTDDSGVVKSAFSVDQYGNLSINKSLLAEAVTENYSDLYDLFVGSVENPGFGTSLKEYVDGLDSYQGLLTLYGDRMGDRKTTLEEDKENAIEALDDKYALLAMQFSEYGAIITQMETSFGGLKMMIQQSTSG
jgi:flagellar hook-associated protein 2